MDFFIKGLILGFSVAAPIGPIGLLCINRTINKNYLSGFVTGLGAATADMVYGLAGGLGLKFISEILIGRKVLTQTIGLVFLFILGLSITFKKNQTKPQSQTVSIGLLKDYLSSLMLTITNPATILFFIAVFSGLGLSKANDTFHLISLVSGVFFGSAFWWLFLSCTTNFISNKLDGRIIKKINLISGLLISAFALYLFWEMVLGYK